MLHLCAFVNVCERERESMHVSECVCVRARMCIFALCNATFFG
jgi:hypothetical protein